MQKIWEFEIFVGFENITSGVFNFGFRGSLAA
jgi:hypothetical protein